MNQSYKYPEKRIIDIVFTGLRPGEKLYEELFIDGEEYQKTCHEKLFVVKNASGFVPENLDLAIEKLSQAATVNDADSIVCWLKQVVPEYKPKKSLGNFDNQALGQSLNRASNGSVKLPVSNRYQK